MKTILVSLYKLDELAEQAQQKAIQRLWDINVEEDWWEPVYHDFSNLAEYFGITVDLKHTYFSGFYHQGQGSSYTAEIDVVKLMYALKNQTWKQYAPNEPLNFYEMNVDRRVIQLLEASVIDVMASVKAAGREQTIKILIDTNYTYNECINYDRIDRELEKLEEIITDACEELNFYLFRKLRQDYEFRTSEEQVKESILINSCDFTRDGKLY